MPALKNIRQELFCQEYVKDSNDIRSAKAAGYRCSTDSAAAVCAVQVLRSTKEQERIFELTADLRLRVEEMVVDRAWVVKQLVENVNRSLQAMPVLDRDCNPSGVWTYEGHVANRGLELIGKNLGMFSELERGLTKNHHNTAKQFAGL